MLNENEVQEDLLGNFFLTVTVNLRRRTDTETRAHLYNICYVFCVVPLLLLLLLLSTQNKIRFNWIYRLSIESLLCRERTVLFIKIRCSWQSVAIYIYKHTIYARCVQDVDTMSGKFIKLWHEILRCLCVCESQDTRKEIRICSRDLESYFNYFRTELCVRMFSLCLCLNLFMKLLN